MRLLIVLLGFLFAYGSDPCKREWFFTDKEKGWFWKNVCIEKKERKEEKKKEGEKVVKIPWDRLDEMTPSQIRKLRDKVLEIAVMNPTYENVKEYKRLELYIVKKADRFQRVAQLVAMTDPEIASYGGMIPSETPSRVVYAKEKRARILKKLSQYRNRAGLLIAVRKTCPYCRVLKEVIAMYFIPRTGWSVKYVDIDENPGFAYNMNVYAVPDIFLAVMDEKPFVLRIATGSVSYGELIERIYMGLEVYEKGGL